MEFSAIIAINAIQSFNSINANFFGKGIDKFGVLVFKDAITSNVLSWLYIQTETIQYYIELKAFIEKDGVVIKAVVLDGKKGLIQAFQYNYVFSILKQRLLDI